MNLEDLMEVWRSQNVAPLHGVNETLLRLALRRGEANMKLRRRLEKGFTYLLSAFLIGVMAWVFAAMSHDDVLTGGDVVIPVVGASAVLVWPLLLRVSLRAQARREQSFGESLRDQINRQVAQLDFHLRRVDSPAHHLAHNLPVLGWSVAVFFATLRINKTPISDVWSNPRILFIGVGIISVCAIGCTFGIWWERRLVKWELLPRKRQLETLLKEFYDQ